MMMRQQGVSPGPPMTTGQEYEGLHYDHGSVESLIKGVARSESMDITNDPRFFQDNVVNYRLAAFGMLSVVSGLMVQNAMDHIFDMEKHMSYRDSDGLFQLVAFIMLCLVFFMNVISTYVGVAQPYHTIRLMTSGPNGFETAASYYLNKNIVAWRHLAIKCMLLSLPLFVISTGLRLVVKFNRENGAEADDHPEEARIQGLSFCALFTVVGAMLFYMNWKHFEVFRDRYNTMAPPDALNVHMTNMMKSGLQAQPRRGAFSYLDV